MTKIDIVSGFLGAGKTTLIKKLIEEGLEKYSNIWRHSAMERGFTHKYEPVAFMMETPDKSDANHKQNWLADREYQYYQAHKNFFSTLPFLLLHPINFFFEPLFEPSYE